MIKEKIKFPNFIKIGKECRIKMIVKFEQYGNSWVQYSVDYKWWNKRLKKEIKEIFDSNNAIDRRKEIIDAINILSMMYENNEKYVEWQFQELRMGRHG